MKPIEIVRVLFIALVAGSIAFYVSARLSPPPPLDDEVAWLIEEFELTDTQADAVRSLHEDYRPICDAHCAAVMEAQNAVEAAADPTEAATAQHELSALKQVCHAATQAHLEAVAAAMSPVQGQRYLETITPLLSAHEHEVPFGLR